MLDSAPASTHKFSVIHWILNSYKSGSKKKNLTDFYSVYTCVLKKKYVPPKNEMIIST